VQDYDVAALEIHSTARSPIPFNHLACPAEDIEWMSVKNPTWGWVEDLVKDAMILHATRAGNRSSSSHAITT